MNRRGAGLDQAAFFVFGKRNAHEHEDMRFARELLQHVDVARDQGALGDDADGVLMLAQISSSLR